MSRAILAVALLGLIALAAAYDIRKTRTEAPEGWTRLARADPRQVLPFRIALRQQNVDVLEVCFCNAPARAGPSKWRWASAREPSLIFSLVTTSFDQSLPSFSKSCLIAPTPNPPDTVRDIGIRKSAPARPLEQGWSHSDRHTQQTDTLWPVSIFAFVIAAAQWLSRKEVLDLVAPPKEDLVKVTTVRRKRGNKAHTRTHWTFPQPKSTT